MKNSIIKLSILVMLFISLFFSTTIITNAMCVYNLTTLMGMSTGPKRVLFNCGVFCHNSWNIDTNDRKCRSDKKGEVTACWGEAITVFNTCRDIDSFHYCSTHVERHGWVDVEISTALLLECIEKS